MTEVIRKSLRDSAKARWAAMAVVSLSMFGAYFFNYAMSPVKPILESALGWNSADFGIYTGSYAWFNVFFLMLIFSGIILDKLGIRFTGLASTAIMVIGTGINYWAITSVSPSLTTHVIIFGNIKTQVLLSALGFAIFGIGSEATGITISKAIVKWFKGKEMALAMGLQMSIARIGTALALIVSLPLALHFNYSAPILLAFILMLIGVLAFITYTVMDKKLDASEKDLDLPEEEPFRISDIVSIISNKAFWYIAILCVLFYGAVFPFLFYATDFMINKYHVAPRLAGIIPGLLPFGTIFLTPLFGGIYDKKGKGATIMIIGSLMLIFVHGLLAVPFLNNWIIAAILVVILGIAFSLVPSAMWPSVPKIIPENKLGTAYAVIFYIQNIGLMLIPMLLGYVLTATNPNVSPNKAMIKSSIEQSFRKAIAENHIKADEKDINSAVDKTTGRVVDSIVHTTFYIAKPQNEVNLPSVKNEIISNNINNIHVNLGSANALQGLETSFTRATFKVLANAKLNIRYNYEYDILIFTALGILSFVFALLLKIEDKKKGYGLELPNIKKEEE